jgi:5-oxoprolinase (ATP-hydrolysing)
VTGWQFRIDRGGTFTDVIGLAPSGELHIRKVLSVQPGSADGGDPGIRAAREILEGAAGGRPESRIDVVKVGTTVATNALLERKGEPVLLVTTVRFADGLRIGYQSRPDLFARHIVLPDRLYPRVIEANERVDSDGVVLTPLDAERLRIDLERAREDGLRSVAIIFLHGWRHQQHERTAANIAREIGFEEVSVSHELSPRSWLLLARWESARA